MTDFNHRFFTISRIELETPITSKEVIVDHYFYEKNGQILMYKNYDIDQPQMNRDRRVLEYMHSRQPYSQYNIVQIPLAYIDKHG